MIYILIYILYDVVLYHKECLCGDLSTTIKKVYGTNTLKKKRKLSLV